MTGMALRGTFLIDPQGVVKTAEVHKYNLMQKLDVHDRGELIRFAIAHRLVQVPVFEDLAPPASDDDRPS